MQFCVISEDLPKFFHHFLAQEICLLTIPPSPRMGASWGFLRATAFPSLLLRTPDPRRAGEEPSLSSLPASLAILCVSS